MQPINYIRDFNPAQNFIQGLQAGQNILQNRQALAANEMAMKQAEEKRRQQEELKALIQNPNTTADDLFKIAAATNNNEALQYAKSLDDRAKKDVINYHLQIMNAVRNKQPDIAIPMIEQKIAAAKNSGDVAQEEENKQILERLKQNPEATANLLGASLYAVDGGAEALKSWSEPYNKKIELEAKINKWQDDADIKRESNRIAMMNKALERETNELKKKEIEANIAATKQKAIDLANKKEADLSNQLTTFGNMKDSISELLPQKDEKSGIETPAALNLDTVTGKWKGNIPDNAIAYWNQDEINTIQALNALKAQAFAVQASLNKGQGSLTETEGKAYTAALGNLDRTQSPDRIKKALETIMGLIAKKESAARKVAGTNQNTVEVDY